MDNYENPKCIGRGNYGAAYRVTHARSRELMVVKKVPITLLSDEETYLVMQCELMSHDVGCSAKPMM